MSSSAIERREFRLREALEPIRDDYPFILLDCPPALDLLTLNALVAADTLLVPMQAEYFALEGISELMSTLDRVAQAFNPELALEGVLLTMYDDRTNLSQQVRENLQPSSKISSSRPPSRATSGSPKHPATASPSPSTIRAHAVPRPTATRPRAPGPQRHREPRGKAPQSSRHRRSQRAKSFAQPEKEVPFLAIPNKFTHSYNAQSAAQPSLPAGQSTICPPNRRTKMP